ncbi:MAG: hypothetical protein B7Z73_17765, partial [Planctomycetia bacterium 21-64-5]
MHLSTENLPPQIAPIPVLPERLEESEEYRNVLAMTQRLFPGPIRITRKHDPELPEEDSLGLPATRRRRDSHALQVGVLRLPH